MSTATIDVHTGKIFTRTRRAFNSGKKVIIHKGGTGSGKTYDTMIFLLFNICLTQKKQIITNV